MVLSGQKLKKYLTTFVVMTTYVAMTTISLSATEWHIMHALWPALPLTAQEVMGAVADHTDHRQKLARLVKKGALTHESISRSYLYRPLVSRKQCVNAESGSVLDRCGNFVLQFGQKSRLSDNDIDELRTPREGEKA